MEMLRVLGFLLTLNEGFDGSPSQPKTMNHSLGTCCGFDQNKVMETLLGGFGLQWPLLAPFYQSGPGSKQKVWKTDQFGQSSKGQDLVWPGLIDQWKT